MECTIPSRAICAAIQGLAIVALIVLGAATIGAGNSSDSPRLAQASQRDLLSTSPPAVVETGCSSDSGALCLNDSRFRVEAVWTTPEGVPFSGHAVALTPDSGYFWFFEPGNVELIVKALNGCGFNGHYWIFAGGLTNLGVTLIVTDTLTGEVRSYSNPRGNAFQPIIDTAAFETCTAAALSAGNPEEPAVGDSVSAPVPAAALVREDSGGCVWEPTALCIRGRFRVEANWESAAGVTGIASAVPLTSESGYFWFFSPSNVELVVKTLDACSIGQGQWFFGAGMTTVGVQLRVTDTFTGEVRTYTNPLGAAFLPIQDTSAFSFCPTPTSTSTPTPTPTWTPTPTPTPAPNGIPTIESAQRSGSTMEVRGNNLSGCSSAWTTTAISGSLLDRGCLHQQTLTANCVSGGERTVQLQGPFASVAACSGSSILYDVCVTRTDGLRACHAYQ